jgi:protein TonB
MFASAATAGLVRPLRQERIFLRCLLASIALHALVLIGLSQGDAPAPPAKALLVLTARLAPVATAPRAQPPAPAARPVAPPPSAPKSVSEPRPVQTTRAPDASRKAPADAVRPAPAESAPADSAAAASSASSAAPGQARSAPQPPVGAPTEASARSGSEVDSGTLEQYRLALIVATRRYKRYPAIAMEKGWQGRVEVRMEIGANGLLASASIKRSSGHEILDNQALDMLKKGKTTVQIPTGLRGRAFNVDVPVIFNLDDPGA